MSFSAISPSPAVPGPPVAKKRSGGSARKTIVPVVASASPTASAVAPRKKKPATKKIAAAVVADPTCDGPSQPPPLPPLHDNPQRASLLAFLVQRTRLPPEQIRDAEIGVFNWALARANERRIARNWRNPRFRALYDSKARSVAANLDPTSYVANDRLIARIDEGEFLPHAVASMPPENVFPERWRDVVEMKVRRDEYISNAKPTAMTDQFKCAHCKKRECSYMELQTRSCDEPATLFIQCLSCGHRWRMG